MGVPVWDYALFVFALTSWALYCAMDFHFLEDLLSGFRGGSVQLFYNSSSKLAAHVLQKCEVLKQRYWPTPWLCSPHLQTAFLHFFGRPPLVEYSRQLVRTPDGGTIALDWLTPDDCTGRGKDLNGPSSKEVDETPTVIIIPGLTSDSAAAYVKHIACSLVKQGWRIVVANHRGLGGVSITSDQFYNAGWTEDLRRIINHLHREYPKSPLLAVGTSIGANVLVKYLGEEGDNTPLGAAAAICCPWDLVICDRFICRRPIQKLYDMVLAIGLRGYAALHQNALARFADWELISKSRSVRDFDNNCTRVVSKFETVDTYYRKCSSVYYLDSVKVPMLCISTLDDPVCTKEAIPWDECRVNPNVVLGVTKHGGHLAFFEGLTASGMWWVRATTEFLMALSSSSLMHKPMKVHAPSSGLSPILESTIDKCPYVSISQNGMVGAEERYLESVKLDDDLVTDEGSRKEMASFTIEEHGLDERVISFFPQSEIPASVDTNTCNIPNFVISHQSDVGIVNDSVSRTKLGSKNMKLVEATEGSDSGASTSASSVVLEEASHTIKLSIRDHSELLALESVLSQLLEQVGTLKCALTEEKSTLLMPLQLRENLGNKSFLEAPSLGAATLPASSAFASAISNGTETVTFVSQQDHKAKAPVGSKKQDILTSSRISDGRDTLKLGSPITKGIKGLAGQNRRTLWILAYIAIVTTWPLVGSALLIHARKRFRNVVLKYWLK